MDYIRANTFTSVLGSEKLPDISVKKMFIRSSFNYPRHHKVHAAHSFTPDPSLSQKTTKRNYISQINAEKSDYNSKFTNDTLNNLIQNNAVTFISPNDLINQLEILPDPLFQTIKTPEKNQSFISFIKKSNSPKAEILSFEYLQEYRANNYLSRSNSKKIRLKIEVTGRQIVQAVNKPKTLEKTIKIIPDKTEYTHLFKKLNLGSYSKPSVLCNKKHKYFKSFRYVAASPLKSAQMFYIPSKNLK